MQVDVVTLVEGVVIVVGGLYLLLLIIAMGMDTYADALLGVFAFVFRIGIVIGVLGGLGWLVFDFIGRVT